MKFFISANKNGGSVQLSHPSWAFQSPNDRIAVKTQAKACEYLAEYNSLQDLKKDFNENSTERAVEMHINPNY